MKKLFWLRIIIVFGAIIGSAFLTTFNMWKYCDHLSVVVTLGFALIVIRMTASPKEFISYFKQTSEKSPFDEAIAEKGIVFFETLQNLLIAFAVLATFIGIIAILQDLKNLEIVGKSTGTALLAALYSSTFIVLITIPFKSALKKRIAENE